MGHPRVMITGAAGFLGTEVASQLSGAATRIGVDLLGVPPLKEIEQWVPLGPTDDLEGAVRGAAPDIIVHAAFRNRKPAEVPEDQYLEEAQRATESLFRGARAAGSRVLLISSSAVYGEAAGRQLIDEDAPLDPVSPYGRAKVAAEQIARAHDQSGHALCIVRPFNLLGPRAQPDTFMTDWVRQAIDLKRGATDAVYIHHRRTSRDFVDVRDAARAIVQLTSEFRSGIIFNIASERAVTLLSVSQELERLAGGDIRFVETSEEVPATDVLVQCGSSRKLREATGWRPRIDWQQSLADLWRTFLIQE